jgi:hypothetical protein
MSKTPRNAWLTGLPTAAKVIEACRHAHAPELRCDTCAAAIPDVDEAGFILAPAPEWKVYLYCRSCFDLTDAANFPPIPASETPSNAWLAGLTPAQVYEVCDQPGAPELRCDRCAATFAPTAIGGISTPAVGREVYVHCASCYSATVDWWPVVPIDQMEPFDPDEEWPCDGCDRPVGEPLFSKAAITVAPATEAECYYCASCFEVWSGTRGILATVH